MVLPIPALQAAAMFRSIARLTAALTVLAGLALGVPAAGADATNDAAPESAPQIAAVRQPWKILDYLGVDYSGAVVDGNVVSPSEFAEMREFAATARKNLAGLSASAAQADLLKQA